MGNSISNSLIFLEASDLSWGALCYHDIEYIE